jgi:hypothetical protein
VTLSGASLGAQSRKLRIFLAQPVNPGQTVTISYDKDTGTALKDSVGNTAANMTNVTVNNGTQSVTSISGCTTLSGFGSRYELTSDITSIGECMNIQSSSTFVTLDCK